MSFTYRALFIAMLAVVAARTAPASAVTITSPDGRWEAWITSTGSLAGQPMDFFDNNSGMGNIDNLIACRHYVRLGTSLLFGAVETVALDDAFEFVDFQSTSYAYTAVLRSTGFSGVLAIIHGEMVSGSAGGLRVSISFIDITPSGVLQSQVSVKPFVYADINAAGAANNGFGGWVTNHFEQAYVGGIIAERWFAGRAATAHESRADGTLDAALDAGLLELNNSTVASGNIECAISFAAASINGSVHTIAYAIGNAGIVIPDSFGLPPNAGSVGISGSGMGAMIRTGLGHPDFGSAGEVASVTDLGRPLGQGGIVNDSAYFIATTTDTAVPIQSIEDTYTRVTFFYPSDAPTNFHAVLRSETQPGVIAILHGGIYGFDDVGVVVTMKFIDITGANRIVRPYVYADLNIDSTTTNTGGFETDHFFQTGSGANPTTRWFKAASFDQYMSMQHPLMLTWLSNGHHNLNNSAVTGPADIAAAFRMHAWRLKNNEPYVTGFAIGDPNLPVTPFPVQPSVNSACSGDIAPLEGDEVVNVDDLLAVINAWGPCPGGAPTCHADIAPQFVGNGQINVDDLLLVINAWGNCLQN